MFGDIGKMLKMVGEMKRKMPEMRRRLAESEFTAAGGGGAVSATVNGKMELIDLKIGDSLLTDPETAKDSEMLADLVKAAVSAAQAKAAHAAQEAMKELTGGMDLPGLTDMM